MASATKPWSEPRSVEIREFAERILLSPELEEKLLPPDEPLTDSHPGPAVRIIEPARMDSLRFFKNHHGAKMPKLSGMRDPRLRAIAHHIMANHELQALEAMAWTLCAFPDAPTPFRLEIIQIMRDEQRHTKMHLRRLNSLGMTFGEIPVNGHVWMRNRQAESLLDYLACVPLTFEGGNLDHSLEFAEAFDGAQDFKSREIMKAIHVDEIDHVAFGLKWFRELKPRHVSDWDAYLEHLHWPMSPYRAKGNIFQREARKLAGMDDEFIDQIEKAGPPIGKPAS